MRGRAQLCVTGSLPSGTGRTLGPLLQPARTLGFGPSPGAAVAPGARWGPPGQGWDHVCVPPQSQQPPPPVQHLPKPRGEATLKMRASVRMTRYLESWGAARPFAHLSHRESLSSGGTPVPPGRRPKVGPGGRGLRGRGLRGGPTLPAGLVPPSWEVRGACRRVGPAPGVCDGPVLRVPQTGFGPGLEACSWGSVQHPLVLDSDDLFFSPPGHPPAAPPDP